MQGNQRWRSGREHYRPPDEPIPTRFYDVAPILQDGPARAFIEAHHYSRSYPAARFRYGLYRSGELVGVAVYSHPVNDRTLTNVFPAIDRCEGVELGRFVLLDRVEGNGETWFLARTWEYLRREGIRGLVSFSDPEPRTTACGRIIHPGHIGGIYQAANARYLGRGVSRPIRLLPDGRVLSARMIQKIRAGETGWWGGVKLLESFGVDPLPGLASVQERIAWLDVTLPIITRRMQHRGNHRYAWWLQRQDRRKSFSIPAEPYPKRELRLLAA